MMFKTPVSSHHSALIWASHLKEAIFMLLFVRDHRPLIWHTDDPIRVLCNDLQCTGEGKTHGHHRFYSQS